MIKMEQLTKQYETTVALQSLDLEIRDGEIFGLIGHNGAGKTTTISLLTSMIHATSGTIYIDGREITTHRDEIKRMIGYVPDSPDIFLNLTAKEYWDFLAKIYEIPKETANERIAELSHLFDMDTKWNDTIESFSHGMRQKVVIIGSLVSNPDIWILDEPLTGLDPQASYDLKQLMKRYASGGHTVLFSTHMLSVAEEVCDRIAILKKGQLIFVGTMEMLREQYEGENLEEIYLRLAGNHGEESQHEVV